MKKFLAFAVLLSATGWAQQAPPDVKGLPSGVKVVDASTTGAPPKTDVSTLARADLEKELAALKESQAQLMANLQAVGGAIQEVEILIAKLDAAGKPAPSSPPKAKAPPGK